MHEYTCPACSAVLRSKVPAPEGRKIRCKNCNHAFIPGGDPAVPKEKAPAKIVDDDEGGAESYGMAEDPAADEEARAVKYGEVEDKFKRSSRGPAMALMVLPTNLLIVQGALTFIAGVLMFLYGIFPLVFADVEPSEEEYREQAGYMIFGLIVFAWGCLICFGASKMQNLESYTWGWVGAVAGLPAGLFAGVMLRNPKVIAGFQEMVGALDDDEDKEKEEDEDDDEDEEDDDEDEEEEEKPRKRRK